MGWEDSKNRMERLGGRDAMGGKKHEEGRKAQKEVGMRVWGSPEEVCNLNIGKGEKAVSGPFRPQELLKD